MEKKSEANIGFIIRLDFGGTVPILGLCPGHFKRNFAKNLRQTPSAGLLFFVFSAITSF